MIIMSTAYLVWSAGAKVLIDEKVATALGLHGINPSTYESTPAPFNTLLWRGVAIEGNHYYEIWTSVFDKVDEVQIKRYPRI